MKKILPSVCVAMLCVSLARAAEAPPRIERDVAYLAPGRTEKLDVYFPAPPAAGKLSPAVVWIHGGGWTSGDKGEARGTEICTTLANAGYFAVSINYNLGNDSWPTDLLDCKNAIRFVRAHAAEYHVDPARIAVAGGSAGGHLALMVGFTAGKKEWEPAAPYPGVSNAVRCVINMYGAVDLFVADKPEQPAMQSLMKRCQVAFGATALDAEIFHTVSPLRYVTKESPPVLTLHGKADATIDFVQAEILQRALQEHGVEHELIALEGIGHAFNWEQSGTTPLPRDLRPVALAFLAKHLGPAPTK